jgi:two-component system, sensor histidine kinase
MSENLLQLNEKHVLAEQLKLLLRNAASALLPTFALSSLLVWALSNDSNATAMNIWMAALMSSKLFATYQAHRHLASEIPFYRTQRLVWKLVFLNVLDGVIWGALAWITLDTSSVAGSILVISTIAAMVGSSMSRLSPVLPIFIAFVATMLLIVASKIWLLGNPAYRALGIASIIYLISLILMARNSSREIRDAINLRFENINLLEKLQIKTEAAETAQRAAEHANTAKSKFLAAASHDLRQPIHAQGLFLEVLSRTELTLHQRELLNNARSASGASSEMLDTLLDFSRIEAGVIEPHILSFSLQTLLHKIENDLAPLADEKNIVYRSRDTHYAVQSDPVLLELILRNLVSNAIRYTREGGVLVACRRHNNQAIIEVWDTGIGIEQAQQHEVFREFHQLGNPERDRHKGLGLGLAIAEGLARTLGHRLSLASTPQRGSVFRLTLPVATAPILPEDKVTSQSKNRLRDVCVLFIDDDAIVREGMLHLLRDWGCVCEAVETIEEALSLAREHAPDLVISDYRLREQRTGVEAINALRGLLSRNLPAILITGDTAPERLREAQASGVPLLHKPVSPSQLYQKLIAALDHNSY